MTLFTEDRTGTTYIEQLTAPGSEVLGLDVAGTFIRNPIPGAYRTGELVNAQQGVPSLYASTAIGALGAVMPAADVYVAQGMPGLPSWMRQEPDSPLVGAEDARQRIKDSGVSLTVPDSGIRQRALDVLIDRKHEEVRRNAVAARAPSGFGFGSLRMAAVLATSAVDPINIGSAFIPIVGPERYAAMVARAGNVVGRTAVRAGVGAVEGAVGQALVEPFVYSAAQAEQADYNLGDSLLNIALGTALGGGLHIGVGAAGDIAKGVSARRAKARGPIPAVMERANYLEREAALRTATEQVQTGKEIDVEPIVRAAQARTEDITALASAEEAARAAKRAPPIKKPTRMPADPELKMPRFPVLNMLKKAGGVKPGSPLAQLLEREDITPLNLPWVFNKRGLSFADEFPRSESPLFSERMSGEQDLGGKISEEEILNAIKDEKFGRPLRTQDQIEKINAFKAQMDAFEPVQREGGPPREFAPLDAYDEPAAVPSSGKFVPLDEGKALGLDKYAPNELGVKERVGIPAVTIDGKTFTGWDHTDAMNALTQSMISGEKATDAEMAAIQDVVSRIDENPERHIGFVTREPSTQPSIQPSSNVKPGDDSMAAPEISKAADVELKKPAPEEDTQIEADTKAIMQDLKAWASDPNVKASIDRVMEPFDELDQTAEAYGRAVLAAAECGLTKGTG